MRSIVAVAVLLTLLSACGQAKSKQPPAPQAEEGPRVSAVTPSAATLEKLAAADRLDGTEDKVIERCPACDLRMAGKEEFSCRVGEYTIHSCSDHCSEAICKDPDHVFGQIEIPAK